MASNDVTVISGTEVVTTFAVGNSQMPSRREPHQRIRYVVNQSSKRCDRVLTGTEVITTIAVGTIPGAIGVNPASGYIYVANSRPATM